MSEELRQGPGRQPRDFLIDLLRGSPFGKQLFSGMDKHGARRIGDRVFGTQDKVGAIDFTPLGIPEAARRTTSELGKGDLLNAIKEAAGLIPGGFAKSAAKPVGSMVTKMLQGGRRPLYGLIDEADNSLVMSFGGSVGRRTPQSPEDFQVLLQTAIPDSGEVQELFEQGLINKRQLNDTLSGPRLLRWREEGLENDELLLRGLKPGNAVKSGVVTGSNSRRNVLDAIGAASLTKPLKDAEGVVTGHRITGGKSAHDGPPAAIDLGLVRRRAKKQGIKPAQDLSIPFVIPDTSIGTALDSEIPF